MSAWIVSKRHIDVLVTGLIEKGITVGDPTAIGKELWTENLKSIHARYPDTMTGRDYPGPNDFRGEKTIAEYVYEPYTAPFPAWLEQQVACYRYQCCEHRGWEASQAFKWTEALELAAEAAKISGFPSKDVYIPWGVK